MTPKNNKAPLLYYIKLCASFQIHWCIQTGVTVRKCSIRVKIGDFFVPRDLEIWWMTLKNNKAPFLYHIKLCAAFQSHWHIQTEFTVRKRSIRFMKNNRAPLLCCFNLCASFHGQWWIQTVVTVRKRPIWVKINDFISCVTLKFDRWPWRTIGYLF